MSDENAGAKGKVEEDGVDLCICFCSFAGGTFALAFAPYIMPHYLFAIILNYTIFFARGMLQYFKNLH